jgi:hypothetical protein
MYLKNLLNLAISLMASRIITKSLPAAILVSISSLSFPGLSLAESVSLEEIKLESQINGLVVKVYAQGNNDRLYMNIWDNNSKSFVANANQIPVKISQVKINSNDDWIKLLGIPAIVSAVVSAIATYIANRKLENFKSQKNAELENFKSRLSADNNIQLEALRHQYTKEREEYLQYLEKTALTEDQIKNEIIRWANPILGAVQDLEGRLNNILQDQGFLALDQRPNPNPNPNFQLNPNWSISYDYFMPSTLYYFAQYFCWILLLLQDLNWLIFKSQTDKDQFFDLIDKVRHSLSSFPPSYPISNNLTGKDIQVFSLQQRAIGELLIVSNDWGKECMKYSEFKEKSEQEPLKSMLSSLREFLESVKPGEHRWERLKATKEAITQLREYCENLLEVSHSQ